MSGLGWQDLLATLLAVGALGYLIWRKLRAKKRAEGAKELVTLGRRQKVEGRR